MLNLRLSGFARLRADRYKRVAGLLCTGLLVIAVLASLHLHFTGDGVDTSGTRPDRSAVETDYSAVYNQVAPIDVDAYYNHAPALPADNELRDQGTQSFSRLLASQDFESAVEVYDQIYTNLSIEQSAAYRESILDYASDLIQRTDAELAVSLLNQYVAIYFTDVEALIMLGQAYKESGSKLEAIQSLQQAYQYEHRIGFAGLILSNANTILGEYVQELKDADDQQAIVDVYRWLTYSQPGVSGYFIALAQAYAAQRRYSEAADALRYVKNDIKFGHKARSLLQELAAENNI